MEVDKQLREAFRQSFFEAHHEREKRARTALLDPLHDWVNELVQRPLPADWRDRLFQFLGSLDQSRFRPTRQARLVVEWWIVLWARFRGFLPANEDVSLAAARARAATVAGRSTIRPRAPKASDLVRTSNADGEMSKLPKDWPRLTNQEWETHEFRASYQPAAEAEDSQWEQRFESFGQIARDHLLSAFRELAAEGSMARATTGEPSSIDAILDQHARVQRAYDQYLLSRKAICEEWARYLSLAREGVERQTAALVDKLNRELPVRIDGLASPVERILPAAIDNARQAFEEAGTRFAVPAVSLGEPPNIATAPDISAHIHAAQSAGRQAFKRAIAAGLAESAARRAAIGAAIAHLALAASNTALLGRVVPAVLSAAGLDDADVHSGLAVYASLFAMLGLRVLPKSASVPTSVIKPSRDEIPKHRSHAEQGMVADDRNRAGAGDGLPGRRGSQYPPQSTAPLKLAQAATVRNGGLSIQVVQAAQALDNSGAAVFKVKFEVGKAGTDKGVFGWIIQHVRIIASVTDCKGLPIKSRNSNTEYTEAWQVYNGQVFQGAVAGANIHRSDTFETASEGKDRKGTIRIAGYVAFVRDYDLPWIDKHEAPEALGLPSIKGAPAGWNDSKAQDHSLTIEFNSCAERSGPRKPRVMGLPNK